MSDAIKKISNMKPDFENMSLAERINFSHMGNGHTPKLSGRGHGRKTPHGRGSRDTSTRRRKKQDMLYLVRDIVRELRMYPPQRPEWVGRENFNSHDLANQLVKDVQYFDCSNIEEYIYLNCDDAYPDFDVPPHPDVILPAETVGLYFASQGYAGGYSMEIPDTETVYICEPLWQDKGDLAEYKGRYFHVSSLTFEDEVRYKPLGNIVNYNDDCTFELNAWHLENNAPEATVHVVNMELRHVAMALQTINQPRFVTPSKRDVSMVKRQAFRKATGRFTPDSWNLVSWNVDKPVKAKPYEEGGGGKQALHFRRGHWRKAKEQWDRPRWSETRNRCETHVHGYEAGHPAFGVKKSYHMPRKEAS